MHDPHIITASEFANLISCHIQTSVWLAGDHNVDLIYIVILENNSMSKATMYRRNAIVTKLL